jgi:hypothetical protein
MRGAIMPSLNFFVSFFFQEKKERQQLAVRNPTKNTYELNSIGHQYTPSKISKITLY